ncbi:MAG: S-layer homology domain-containing protein [Oscillospiraceae bacterium]|nr:S-layer homology domain-containing protein [Oscillospiraceae bacterium]
MDNSYKRAMSLLLAALTAAAMFTSRAVAAAPDFADVTDEDPHYGAILYCADRGFVRGVSPTHFAPDAALTREQFAVVWARTFHVRGPHTFRDVPRISGGEVDNAIVVMHALGFFNGVSDTEFGRKTHVTREQAAAVLARTYLPGVDGDDACDNYPDAGSISPWARDAVSACVEHGLFDGAFHGDNLFPQNPITRGELCQLLLNVMGGSAPLLSSGSFVYNDVSDDETYSGAFSDVTDGVEWEFEALTQSDQGEPDAAARLRFRVPIGLESFTFTDNSRNGGTGYSYEKIDGEWTLFANVRTRDELVTSANTDVNRPTLVLADDVDGENTQLALNRDLTLHGGAHTLRNMSFLPGEDDLLLQNLTLEITDFDALREQGTEAAAIMVADSRGGGAVLSDVVVRLTDDVTGGTNRYAVYVGEAATGGVTVTDSSLLNHSGGFAMWSSKPANTTLHSCTLETFDGNPFGLGAITDFAALLGRYTGNTFLSASNSSLVVITGSEAVSGTGELTQLANHDVLPFLNELRNGNSPFRVYLEGVTGTLYDDGWGSPPPTLAKDRKKDAQGVLFS